MSGIRVELVVALLLATAVASAAEPKKVNVGEAKISWQDLPGADGKKHSSSDLKDRDVIVLVVTCNHCPIALEYFDRIKDFASKYCDESQKVALVSLSVSKLETDGLERMTEVAKRKSLNFPYLFDATQKIGRDLGATCTPQFFVLDKRRVLVYRGAWDDELNVSKVTKRYVETAVNELLAGKPLSLKETKAKGCEIEYEN